MVSAATQDILIEVSPGETRVAILRGVGGRPALYELLVDRMSRPSRVGAIVAGRVVRVDATGAFVDLGGGESGLIPRARGLTQGKRLAVQVVRDSAGGKGPGLTQSPVLSGRYLAIQPGRAGVTWSRRFGGQRREALEAWVAAHAAPEDGLTLRPPAAVVDDAVLTAELARLRDAWSAITVEAASAKPGTVLLAAPGLAERVLRDRIDVDGAVGILCDDRRLGTLIEKMIAETMPDLTGALTVHADPAPLFEAYGVEEQVETAVAHRTALAGGGTLVFDETEALTAIDVNMGEADGGGVGRGQSRTDAAIFALNRVAAGEVARHIVLRNLTGLIVIDFISLRNKGHRRDLVELLRRHLRSEATGSAVPVDVLGMTAAGLVEVTRQRTAPPLADLMLGPTNRLPAPAPDAQACAALRAALRLRGAGRPVLRAAPGVIALLEGALASAAAETGRRMGQPLQLVAEPGRTGYTLAMERTP